MNETNREREAVNKFPPLPEPVTVGYGADVEGNSWDVSAFTDDQMREYGARCAAAALASRPAEPVESCDVLSSGWACTRRKGHSGPCAAIPTGDGAPITKEFARRFPGTAAGMVNALAARVDELETARTAESAVEPRHFGSKEFGPDLSGQKMSRPALPATEPRAAGLSKDQIAKVAREGFDSVWHEGFEGDESDAWAAAGHAVLTAASPQPGAETAQGQWVSVDERLPEKGMRVLVFDPDFEGIDGSAMLTCEGWERHEQEYDGITHWMPLPPAPRVGLAPAPAVEQGLSDEAADRFKADANSIFNDLPVETAQEVRDVIEWYDASLRVALTAAKPA